MQWLLALLLTSASGFMAAEPLTLPARKAAYTYYFTKFIDWPTPHSQQLRLCVATARSDLLQAFRRVAAQPLGSQQVALMALDPDQADQAAIPTCHVFYAGSDISPRWQPLLVRPQKGLLVVADDDAAITVSAIRFIARHDQLSFSIDRRRARAAGLTLSAKLIALGEGL